MQGEGVGLYHNFVNNSWNCIKFEAQGNLGCPFELSYVDFGETSRDLSMTLTVFFIIWAYVDVSTETIGVGMVYLEKS